MLSQQQTLPLSNHYDLYDLIIPQNNQLRRINDLIDFSFIYEELEDKYCLNNGRKAESPIRMFKYLLLKIIFDISDVDVVERSRYDMSFKYFLGMTPEEDVINPSSLTKFRKLRLKDSDLLTLLINKTVVIALEKGIIKSKSIIVDATHTKSRSNPLFPLEVLKERAKHLRKTLYDIDDNLKEELPEKNTDNDLEHEISYCKSLIKYVNERKALSEYPKVSLKLNILKESLEDTEERFVIAKDEDARIGHKSEESSFFGFKTHIAMSEERIITGAVVTSGEKGDGPILRELIDESEKNGIDVEVVIGDTAYSGKDNLKLANEQNIKIVAKLNPSIAQGTRKDEDKFDFNKDADMFICPAGHMAIRRAKQGKKDQGSNQTYTYYFDIEKCKICPLKNGCYKDGAKSKSYSVSINSKEHQNQIEFQNTEFFKEKARHRYKIEAKNSELKNVYGYDRAHSYGLSCMQMQGALTIFAANIKRILKLL
ncbi:MAG: IS1182 family transposase [Bacteroidales bacterium]